MQPKEEANCDQADVDSDLLSEQHWGWVVQVAFSFDDVTATCPFVYQGC